MKYVFFDIECACVFKNVAKICAFGYVVADENFRVLAREDILINPKGKFHLTDRKGNEGIVLPYEYDEFKNHPPFPAVYAKIKGLLEEKGVLVFGHATMNDVNYLNLETKRYKLPSFRFPFYDTQFLFMNTEGDFSRQYGLQAMAEALGVAYTPHRAADDAYATMCVLEALLKRENATAEELFARFGIRPGKVSGYRIALQNSSAREEYLKKKEREREVRSRARVKFFRYVDKNMRKRNQSGALEGKAVCFSKELEEDAEFSIELVKAVFACGGRYTSKPRECNVYIAREESGVRLENARKAGAAFLPLEEALSLLGVGA